MHRAISFLIVHDALWGSVVPSSGWCLQVEEVLSDEKMLEEVGTRAASIARHWTEQANATELIRIVKDAIT
jgi:hypothetical protein